MHLEYGDALLFTVACCGFIPRSADESGKVSVSRMERILHAINTSDYSIHDLSRCRGEGQELLARNLSTLPYLGQMLARPSWLWSFFRDGGLMHFPNIVLPSGPMGYADVGAALEQSMVSWDDFRWIRDAWQGPIVVKGAHTADDARKAVDHGANAVVVSNHGARQLDGVAPGDGPRRRQARL